MAIRIDRIKVNRGGPLEEDFKLEAGDINLIYGRNETGKTYIVESIINLLFRTGKKSTIPWNLRGWDFAGSIIVSGLQDKPTTFSRTGKKLEDYCEEEIGLPQDFSRLLVVKEGETLLAREDDGVGRDILKDYLSGEGLLDRIQVGISSTLREARVENGQIFGPNRGELKKREQLMEDLEELDSLLKEAEDGYASGEVYSLRQRQETLKAELEKLKKAKLYDAACLHSKRESLRTEAESLPNEEELSQIESDISVYQKKRDERDEKSNRLSKLESKVENYMWAEQALKIYKEVIGGRAVASPKTVYMIVALLFLLGAAVTGFLNLSIPLGICVVGSLAFSVLYFAATRRALATAGINEELERLKTEFKTRFGSELTDGALLEAQAESLREDYFAKRSLKEELDENLTPNLKIQENNIRGALKTYMGRDLSEEEWRPVATELRGKLKSLAKEISSLNVELASLGVPEEELLDEDPGAKWDPDTYSALDQESAETKQLLEQELQKLDQLKARIAQETHSNSTEWEELINTLRDRQEKVVELYRLATAEILAKIQINKVVEEFREEENARISTGLESDDLTKPLYAITGSYRNIRHEADRGLILVTDQDEEYPLADVSTGAREQAFLALRMGFSSIIMKGQRAFLILDDAFQHSDWPRRTNLMDQVLRIVEGGWQVFYFTMDDHIRDLFLKVGEKVGDKFRSLELR